MPSLPDWTRRKIMKEETAHPPRKDGHFFLVMCKIGVGLERCAMNAGAQGGERCPSGPLKLKLQMVVRYV